MNHFLRLAALGYTRTLPIIPPGVPVSEGSSLYKRLDTSQDGRGKTPGIKGRDGNWFSFDWAPYEADEADYERWHRMSAGTGIKTGAGLIAIDADTLNEDHAKTIHEAVKSMIGTTPIRVGQYPKALYLVRVNGPFQYQRVEFGPPVERNGKTTGRQWRVEVLSDGRQFVAEGIHPKTKEPYQWVRPLTPHDELPIVSPAAVTAFLEHLRVTLPDTGPIIKEGATTDISQASLRGDPAMVRKAVEAIPNTSANFPSRESYRDFGYAIKAALPDDEAEALALFEDWCARWEEGDNDPDVVSADWSRMKPPYRRGAGWLYEQAEQLGGGKFSIGDVWLEDLDDPDNPFQAIDLNAENSGNLSKSKKFDFLDFNDVAATGLTNPALIKGLLDEGAMSVLYGDSNVGKTFVAMDIAFHIGAGLAYGGLRTKAGLVVYIAAEGGNGAKKRLVALRERFPKANPAFKLLPSPVDLRKPDADLVPLMQALRDLGEPVAFLVIDTLSRAMAGGDENSSVDMGALVKHFDMLRKAVKPAHLMVVHHTGKERAKGARGHSLLRAATDTEIEVAENVITATKQRDMDKSWTSGFKLRVHRLGVDSDGDPITSCTVDLLGLDEARAIAAKPTAKERDVLQALALASDERKGAPTSTRDVAAAYTDDTSDRSVSAVRQHLRNLATKGYVEKPSNGFWALKGVGNGFLHLENLDDAKNEALESVEEVEEDIFS